jgi:hypothetical protein
MDWILSADPIMAVHRDRFKLTAASGLGRAAATVQGLYSSIDGEELS